MCIFHACVCVLKKQITVGVEEEFEKIIFAKHTIFCEIREIYYPQKKTSHMVFSNTMTIKLIFMKLFLTEIKSYAIILNYLPKE